MLDFSKNKDECCGCTACLSACPMHCISMVCDEEGFLYPLANDCCIHCGKCTDVCPIQHPGVKNEFTQKFYAGTTLNHEVWTRSASGGAFSEICRAWDRKNTLYVGAIWDSLRVRHKCISGMTNIAPLCKSKYIESEQGDIFSLVQEHLEKGGSILYSGTPCQVAGLKRFLGKEYENLLLIDFICHGVGSPKVFDDCVLAIEKQFKKKVVHYEFRTKRKTYELPYLSKVSFEDGKSEVLLKDPYMQLYLSQNCLRPCCVNNCKYRCGERESDITIADFKGLTEIFPELLGVKQNYSSIIINTSKGEAILSNLKNTMDLHQCTEKDINQFNPLFSGASKVSGSKRSLFFEQYLLSPEKVINTWTVQAQVYPEKLQHKIFAYMPVSLRRILLRKKHKYRRSKKES